MTAEKKVQLKELQKLFKLAVNAAEYLNKKADECKDKTRRAILRELAETATAEADKYFAEEQPLWDEAWENIAKKNSDNPWVQNQLAKLTA